MMMLSAMVTRKQQPQSLQIPPSPSRKAMMLQQPSLTKIKNVGGFVQMQPSRSLVVPWEITLADLQLGQSLPLPPGEQDNNAGLGTASASPVGGNFSVQQTGRSVAASFMHTRLPESQGGCRCCHQGGGEATGKEHCSFLRKDCCHPKAAGIHGTSPALLMTPETKSLTCFPAPPFLLSVAHPSPSS